MAVKPIPDGYHSVTPYLTIPGVAKLLDFLKRGPSKPKSLHRMPRPARRHHACRGQDR